MSKTSKTVKEQSSETLRGLGASKAPTSCRMQIHENESLSYKAKLALSFLENLLTSFMGRKKSNLGAKNAKKRILPFTLVDVCG
jgi:hypothetical protein